MSRDSRCGHVDQVTQGLNEHEANKAFCSMDLVEAIIRDEKLAGLAAPVVKNTKVKCSNWMKKYGYKFHMKHLVESPAWNQILWDEGHGSIKDRIGEIEDQGDGDDLENVDGEVREECDLIDDEEELWNEEDSVDYQGE
jgi:hypothetical protein